jgi:GNAT superfamily N-acetyltransferase
MVRRWAAAEIVTRPAPEGVKLRDLAPDDGEALGRLLWSGVGSDGLDGFASANAARHHARTMLAGNWGPMVWAASVLAVIEQTAVAASVVLRDEAHQFLPLLGVLVTEPRHRRRGIADSVLAETLWRMNSLDVCELHLAVSPENPARTLYGHLGFRDEPWSAPPPA